jgi:LysM repeat protein
MKWKDSSEMVGQEDITSEEYFDEEQFSPWTANKAASNGTIFKKIPKIVILLGIAIVTSIAALLILLMGGKQGVPTQQIKLLEERILNLEERLDKFEAIDEKVTRIWEQAKSYEKFKDRYERSEASMSLRMDHLTMSLESLQKQLSASSQAVSTPTKSSDAASTTKPQVPETNATHTAVAADQPNQYHVVEAGDTYYSISRRYNLSLDTLLSMNHLTKKDVLIIGQKLIVSGGPTN